MHNTAGDRGNVTTDDHFDMPSSSSSFVWTQEVKKNALQQLFLAHDLHRYHTTGKMHNNIHEFTYFDSELFPNLGVLTAMWH